MSDITTQINAMMSERRTLQTRRKEIISQLIGIESELHKKIFQLSILEKEHATEQTKNESENQTLYTVPLAQVITDEEIVRLMDDSAIEADI